MKEILNNISEIEAEEIRIPDEFLEKS